MKEQVKVTPVPIESKWVEAGDFKDLSSWEARRKFQDLRKGVKWTGLILRPRDRSNYTMWKTEDELDIADFCSVDPSMFRYFAFVAYIGKAGHLMLKNRLPAGMDVPGLKEILP